jgi:excisionase family DNA binding protein
MARHRWEVFEFMKLLTLSEAAKYLRMSRSNLYQRKDIPRYRRPGSRVVLFDQEELEAWLKKGRLCIQGVDPIKSPAREEQATIGKIGKGVLEIPRDPVYHRNAQYR